MEARTEQLLRMAAALEEAIMRLEARLPDDSKNTVYRLRRLQADILAARSRLEDESQAR